MILKDWFRATFNPSLTCRDLGTVVNAYEISNSLTVLEPSLALLSEDSY